MAIKITNNVNQQEVNRLKNRRAVVDHNAQTIAGIEADIAALPTADPIEQVAIIERLLRRQLSIIAVLGAQ